MLVHRRNNQTLDKEGVLGIFFKKKAIDFADPLGTLILPYVKLRSIFSL